MVKIDASEYDANWITDEETSVESAPPEEAEGAGQQVQAESDSDTPTETEQQAKQAVEALKNVLSSDTGNRDSTAKSGGADNSALSEISEKEWIPYRGPEGGEGWQNAQNPEDIRYVNDPPGEVADGYEDVADEWGSDNGESWTQEDKVAFLQDAITGLEEMRNSGLWNENVNYDDVSPGSAVGVMNMHTGYETQPAIVESVDWDANTMEVTYKDGEVEAARLGDVAFTYNAEGSDVAQQTAEDITSQLSDTDDPFTAIESALPERLRNRFVDAADGHDDPLEALDTFIEEHANDWQVGRTQTLSDVSEGLAEQGYYPDRGEAVSGFGVELPAEDATFEDGLDEVLSKNFEFDRDRTIALQRYVKDRINRDDMDVPDVDAQSQRSFVRTLKSAHDTGMLDSIRKVEREENVSKRGESFAWCAGDSITVKNNLTNENVREYHEDGIAVAETAGGILIHEIAHSLHDTQIREENDTPDDVLELGVKRYTLGDSVSEEGVESEVSQYATANYAEFVAEVFTGLVKGEEYSETVMDKYQNVHGPPLGEVEQFREGMDTLELSENNGFVYPDYLPKPLADEARAIHDLNGGGSVKSVSKDWVPYQGPKGGEGWQNMENPEDVRYQENAPGKVHPDYQDMAEDWGSESESSAEFQEEWEEVTTHHMMSEDTREVQAEASGFLEANTDAKTVSFNGFRPEHIRPAGERFKSLDDTFDLSDIDRFGDHGELQNNFNVDHRNTAGYFMADAGITNDRVHVVAKPNSVNEPRSIRIDNEEWLVTNDRYQTIVHEVAHYLHFKEFKAREDSPRQAWDRYYDQLDSDKEELLKDEVSVYAATSAFEAVAEIATGLMYGYEFSDEVMAIYEEHGGPEVRDMGFEEVSWDEDPEDVTTLKEDENPYLVEAEIVEESFRRWASSDGEAVKSLSKNWIPYVGPQGGEGWQDTQDPDNIRYQTDAPGEVAAGYDDEHWSRDQRAVSEPDHELGYVSDENGPTLNVTTASEAESLAEAGASEGASSRHMHVATWRDSDEAVTHRAFVTNYGPDMERNRTGEKPLLGERAVAADSFLRNLGFGENLPNHFLNRQQRYLAVESVPGKEVREAPDEWKQNVDEERAKDFAAAVMIAGNSDLHSKNILLDEDGTFYAVDVDKSAGDFENGPTRFKNRGVTSIKYALRDMGIDISRGELAKRIETVANRYDADDVLEDVPNSMWSEKDRHQFRDNIRTNLEVAQEGRLL